MILNIVISAIRSYFFQKLLILLRLHMLGSMKLLYCLLFLLIFHEIHSLCTLILLLVFLLAIPIGILYGVYLILLFRIISPCKISLAFSHFCLLGFRIFYSRAVSLLLICIFDSLNLSFCRIVVFFALFYCFRSDLYSRCLCCCLDC
jgi:hypothetical protein